MTYVPVPNGTQTNAIFDSSLAKFPIRHALVPERTGEARRLRVLTLDPFGAGW